MTKYNLSLIYLNVFISAFLLFWSELLYAKIVLPYFGGTPGVWTGCLAFFQTILLFGYGFIVLISQKPKLIKPVFLFLSILSIWSLNKPMMFISFSNPILSLYGYLISNLLFPFFILSCTTPLLHKCISYLSDKENYRIYSFSNSGSLIILLIFPFLIEPYFSIEVQKSIFNGIFYAYILLLNYHIISIIKYIKPSSDKQFFSKPTPLFKWFIYSFTSSALLSSFSGKICQDISVIPFFWIIPLCLYLISWIHSFEFFNKNHFAVLTLICTACLPVISIVIIFGVQLPFIYQLIIYCFTLYIFCLFCHHKIFISKPSDDQSSIFYFATGAGGSAGALYSGVFAPVFFNDFYELHTVILLMCIFLAKELLSEHKFSLKNKKRQNLLFLFVVSVLSAVLLGKSYLKTETGTKLLFQERNFFGVTRIIEETKKKSGLTFKILFCGRIIHGLQFTEKEKENSASSYYSKNSAPGLLFEFYKKKPSIHCGVLGLGTGTLACYARKDDLFSFYEINPIMIKIANSYFSYLKNCKSKYSIFEGDGRKVLENQDQKFDILFIDAFRSDAIPVHLLTIEAFKIYLNNMLPDGNIAVNISNKYVNFIPLIISISNKFNLEFVFLESSEDENNGIMGNQWMVLSKNKAFKSFLGHGDGSGLGHGDGSSVPALQSGTPEPSPCPKPEPSKPPVWTDNYSSIFPLLKGFR